jgi:hypothetical protein
MSLLQKLTNVFRASHSVLRVLLIALALYGVWSVYHWFRPDPAPVVTSLTPTVKTIEVPVEKLVTKTVTQYVRVEDRAMVSSLMDENARLRAEVTRLTVAYAERTSQGTLTPTTPLNTEPRAPETPAPLHYSDWRLSFTMTNPQSIDYTLTQKFALAVTHGVTNKNVPVSLATLYEIGPGDTRTPIPITDTTYLVAAKPSTHWYRDLTIQGGVVSQNNTLTGVVATPWLKRGRTSAAAESRWAVATPAVTMTQATRTLGILPVSLNVGTLPGLRAVVTNIWVSPYFGTNNLRNITHRGAAFTVTF